MGDLIEFERFEEKRREREQDSFSKSTGTKLEHRSRVSRSPVLDEPGIEAQTSLTPRELLITQIGAVTTWTSHRLHTLLFDPVRDSDHKASLLDTFTTVVKTEAEQPIESKMQTAVSYISSYQHMFHVDAIDKEAQLGTIKLGYARAASESIIAKWLISSRTINEVATPFTKDIGRWQRQIRTLAKTHYKNDPSAIDSLHRIRDSKFAQEYYQLVQPYRFAARIASEIAIKQYGREFSLPYSRTTEFREQMREDDHRRFSSLAATHRTDSNYQQLLEALAVATQYRKSNELTSARNAIFAAST